MATKFSVFFIGQAIVLLTLIGHSFAASIEKHELESHDRIVGGSLSKNHGRPYMALVMYKAPYNGKLHMMICGGNVISESWVLTAAHCVEDDGEDYTVHMGMNTWCKINNGYFHLDFSDGHEQRKVVKSIRHPQFSSTFANDIALLKMEQPVTLGGNIQAAQLPIYNNLAGRHLTVAGWGKIVELSNTQQCDLMEVRVEVFTDEKCFPFLKGEPSLFCAGYSQGKKDSCKGDSGGGLVMKYGDKFYLYGIVSYGDGCGRPKSPGFYIRVINFVPWIKENMAKF